MNALLAPSHDTELLAGSTNESRPVSADDYAETLDSAAAQMLSGDGNAEAAFETLANASYGLGQLMGLGWDALEAQHKHHAYWPRMAREIRALLRLCEDCNTTWNEAAQERAA